MMWYTPRMKSLQAQFSVLPTADSVMHLHKHVAWSYLLLNVVLDFPVTLIIHS